MFRDFGRRSIENRFKGRGSNSLNWDPRLFFTEVVQLSFSVSIKFRFAIHKILSLIRKSIFTLSKTAHEEVRIEKYEETYLLAQYFNLFTLFSMFLHCIGHVLQLVYPPTLPTPVLAARLKKNIKRNVILSYLHLRELHVRFTSD